MLVFVWDSRPNRNGHMRHLIYPKMFCARLLAGMLCLASMDTLAQLPNAWKISDNGGNGGTFQYFTNLVPAQAAAANTNGWHWLVAGRMISNGGGTAPSQGFAFGNGTNRFYILLHLNNSGFLTAQLMGDGNQVYTLATNTTSATDYHYHEITFNPLSGRATYRFDGSIITNWPGEASNQQTNQAFWGATSTSGRGQMNYHRVEFEIFNQGVIASYRAGFQNNPLTAPSPVDQAWSRITTTGGAGSSESAVSPDSVVLFPVITLPAASLHRGQATLNALIEQSSQLTAYWFEHGVTTNFGSVTVTQALTVGTGFVMVSNLITGLPGGGTYYFRAVGQAGTNLSLGNTLSFSAPTNQLAASGATGGGQPIDIRQPTVEVNFIICLDGYYPGSENQWSAPMIGEIRMIAGRDCPPGWLFCDGQILNWHEPHNIPLFSLMGTTYGGDGFTNFALPDLRNYSVVGEGTGPGLAERYLGERGGVNHATLLINQVPAHTHTLPAPDLVTAASGGSQLISNHKPTLGIRFLTLFTDVVYPSTNGVHYEPFLGQIVTVAGGTVLPAPLAAGQLISIAQNTALFSLLGNNFGGDGQVTLALPDLSGRSPIGIGTNTGGSATFSIAQKVGADTFSITTNELPAHRHGAAGGLTGFTGNNQPLSLLHPSLALRYLIFTGTNRVDRFTGEITLFGGNFNPGGWLPCDGQLYNLAQYPALFNAISNRFGGDGINTFAVPNFAGRIPVGSPDHIPGATYGSQQITLTEAHLPPHTHLVTALDYDRWISSFGLKDASAAFDGDFDADGWKNGYEWATGANPTNASSFAPLTISAEGDFVKVKFPRNTNATDIKFTLQRTLALTSSNSWTGVVTNQSGVWSSQAVVTQSGATNPAQVTVIEPRTNQPAANYRLRLDWP